MILFIIYALVNIKKNEVTTPVLQNWIHFFKRIFQNDVIKTKLLFSAFLMEHNIPLAAVDCVGPLLTIFVESAEINRDILINEKDHH